MKHFCKSSDSGYRSSLPNRLHCTEESPPPHPPWYLHHAMQMLAIGFLCFCFANRRMSFRYFASLEAKHNFETMYSIGNYLLRKHIFSINKRN